MRSSRFARSVRADALATLVVLTVTVSTSAVSPGAAASNRPAGQALSSDVVVEITSPRPGERLQGRVEITGYAADRRSPEGSGLNERDIQVYLNDSSNDRNLLTFASAGGPSPAAAAALGPRFGQTGFLWFWDTCAFSPGSYQLLVWVSSLIEEGARGFAAVDVELDACPPGVALYQDDLALVPREDRLVVVQPSAVGYIPSVADFAAGVDARCPRAEPDCGFLFTFRARIERTAGLTGAGYLFFVSPATGAFRLAYGSTDSPDSLVDLIPPTRAGPIRGSTETNRLAVVVQGDRLRLFVNGEQVGEARDDRHPWGLLLWNGFPRVEGGRAEPFFTNLVVATPGPVEALAAVLGPAGSAPSAAAPRPAPSAPPPVSAPAPSAPPVSAPAPAAPPAPSAPSAGPSTPGRVLFRDDFSNPNSGWPRPSGGARRMGYEGGEYYMVGSEGVWQADYSFGDFQAEIDARLLSALPEEHVYLNFRRQPNGDFYHFDVDPNARAYRLLLIRPAGGGPRLTPLIGWTDVTAIQGGTAPNRIGVRARGPELVLLVNGQEVGRVRDERLREGSLGFGVESRQAEGRFSNLLVTSVD